MSASVNEASRISSGVPSVEPPSELIMTVRRRGKSRVKHTWTARTTSTIVAALFKRRQPDQDVDLADGDQLPQQRVGEVLSCSTSVALTACV